MYTRQTYIIVHNVHVLWKCQSKKTMIESYKRLQQTIILLFIFIWKSIYIQVTVRHSIKIYLLSQKLHI